MTYLDTSVVVALLTNEAESHRLRHWFAGTATTDCYSADWLVTEFSSAISLKLRTGQMTAAACKTTHAAFSMMIVGQITLLEVSRSAYRHSATLIQSLPGLRSGDALHLAVAMENRLASIATIDKVQARAATQSGFTLVHF